MPDVSTLESDLMAERAAHARTREALERAERAARFIPRDFLSLLGASSAADASVGDAVERKLSVLFADIRDFTPLCEAMGPRETFHFLNGYVGVMEPVVASHHGFVERYIGDGIFALFPRGADDAVAAGVAMHEALQGFNEVRGRDGKEPIRIGVGLNHGIVALGTVGGERHVEGTVVSDAVNLAARLETLTKQYGAGVLVSEATLYALDRAASRTVRYLDRIYVKGKRQPQSIYEIFDADPEPLRLAKTATRAWFEEAVACYHLREIALAEALLRRCLEAAPGDVAAKLYLDRCHASVKDGHHEGTGEFDGTLTWRDEFTLGVPSIDDQHHELVDAMNRLVPSLRAGDGCGCGRTLAFLDDYARQHFGMEAGLMSRHGYPFMAEHLREHDNFVGFLRRLTDEISEGRPHVFLVMRAQVFLMDWFANHSTGTDRHLARWLRARGVGGHDEGGG